MKLLSIIMLTITFLLISTKCSDDVEVVYIKPDSVDVITHYIYETPADSVSESDPDTTEALPFLVSIDTTKKIEVRVNMEKLETPYEKDGKLYPYKITGQILKITIEYEHMSNNEIRQNVIDEKVLFSRNSYAACSGSARRAKESLKTIIENHKDKYYKHPSVPSYQEGM